MPLREAPVGTVAALSIEAVDADGALLRLRATLASTDSAVVALSGGVDSAVVLAAAAAVVPRVLAATGTSVAYAPEDLEAARQIAALLGVEHVHLPTRETTDPRYTVNSPQRCFFCKTELYGKLRELAATRGLVAVLDGTNASDLADFRPGLRAADEIGVRSPLREAGLHKAEVRAIAKLLDLPVWDKPASPCLASRFPYGEAITAEKLTMVAAAERHLRALGFRDLRVRHHGNVARIEVPAVDMATLLAHADHVVAALKAIGYVYVAMDLQGLRSGALNEALPNLI